MIKDQCNNCKKNGKDNCGQTVIFNSLPCEHYAKKLNLSKQNDNISSTGVTTTPLQPAQPQTAAPNNNSNYNGISSDTSFWSSIIFFQWKKS